MDLREVPTSDFTRHPWERARFDFFHRILREHADLASARRVLDVGAGDGWFAQRLLPHLSPDATITCVDPAYAHIEPPAAPPRISFRVSRPDERFDLLLLLDVLEHIDEDASFLPLVVQQNASPNARVLLSTPAWSLLTSAHDEPLGHYRRYSPRQLVELARRSGLRPIHRGELFTSLLLARAAAVAREKVLGPPSSNGAPALHWPYGETSARIVHAALSLDASFCRAAARARLRVPGLSTWVLCELA